MTTLERYAQEIDRLDRDIATAQANQSIAAEALAHECAAEFYLEWGKEKIAAVYRQDAYECYVKAGAEAEIAYLEQHYPQLSLSSSSIIPPTSQLGETNYFTDEFVATVSHEGRDPLNEISKMSVALLQGTFGTLNEQQSNAIQTIDRNGEYLLGLIDSMADLSQLQAGKLKLDLTNVNVSELCQISANFIEHHAAQKQIQLDLKIPIDLRDIDVDFQRMRQVLISLLSHAIDSTPVGGKVELVVTQADKTIEASPLPHHSVTTEFAVIDTSKEILAIETSDDSTIHPVAGQARHVGLGLMLVQPLVAAHGGNLICQSIGKGNCFRVSLPHHTHRSDMNMNETGHNTSAIEVDADSITSDLWS